MTPSAVTGTSASAIDDWAKYMGEKNRKAAARAPDIRPSREAPRR
jgi:hypothetical protein